MGASAVVFAYHDVGVACLSVLLGQGIDVRLVVSHPEDPAENPWFASVEREARARGLAVELPDDPNAPAFLERLQAISPDFIFSFYYRRMLSPDVLACARRGAFNLHGSLLPRYRGRAPVNWAVLNGERETGATLHAMTVKPDAGAIVDQLAVAIGEDELAVEVFRNVTKAAATVLARALPSLIDGSAKPVEQDASRASYFGARRPEDGRIDWSRPAREVHNLVRAVSPPYPGAFTPWEGKTLRILRTRRVPLPPVWSCNARAGAHPGAMACNAGRSYVRCGLGTWIEVLSAQIEGQPVLEGAGLCAFFARASHPLGELAS